MLGAQQIERCIGFFAACELKIHHAIPRRCGTGFGTQFLVKPLRHSRSREPVSFGCRQFLDGPAKRHFPAMQDGNVVTEKLYLSQQMRVDENSDPLLFQSSENLTDVPPPDRIYSI